MIQQEPRDVQGTHTGGIGAPLAADTATVYTEGQAVGEAGTPHMVPSRVLLRAAVHLVTTRTVSVSKCSKSSGMTHHGAHCPRATGQHLPLAASFETARAHPASKTWGEQTGELLDCRRAGGWGSQLHSKDAAPFQASKAACITDLAPTLTFPARSKYTPLYCFALHQTAWHSAASPLRSPRSRHGHS